MAANKSARSLADVFDQAQNARAARFVASFADCVASNADCAAPSSALIESRSNTYFSQGYVDDEDRQPHAENQFCGLKEVAKYEILVNRYHFMVVLSEMECEM
jgi:hypothetical protein